MRGAAARVAPAALADEWTESFADAPMSTSVAELKRYLTTQGVDTTAAVFEGKSELVELGE